MIHYLQLLQLDFFEKIPRLSPGCEQLESLETANGNNFPKLRIPLNGGTYLEPQFFCILSHLQLS